MAVPFIWVYTNGIALFPLVIAFQTLSKSETLETKGAALGDSLLQIWI